MRALVPLLGAAAIWAAAGASDARVLRISPVGLELPRGGSATVLTVRNDGPVPMSIQVRVFRWTQTDGEDRLTPTTDVAVSPPIGEVGPNSERVIRIVRMAPPAATEQSYRLIIDELPPPPDTLGPQVRLVMRHSIPLFISATPLGPSNVTWRVESAPGGLVLSAHNAGGRRIRVSGVRLLSGDGATIVQRPGLLGYVLVGAEARWLLAAPESDPTRARRLLAESDAGAIDVALPPVS